MKRIIYILIFAALWCSCTDHLLDESPYSSSKELIRFSALRDRAVTRYANDNKSDYQAYGIIEGEGSKGWFINSIITPSSSGGNDSVNNGSYYYPYGKNVQFYAYAPSTITTVTTDSSTPSILIDFTVKESAGNDFTIAVPITQSEGKVAYQFKHMLAKMNTAIKLTNALVDAGYAIESGYTTTLSVANNTGKINAVWDYSSTSADSLPTWSDVSGPDTLVTYSNNNSFIFMPQTFTATTVADSITTYGNCTVQIQDVVITLTVNSKMSTVFNGDLIKMGFKDNQISGNEFLAGHCYNISFIITDISKDTFGHPIFNGAIDFSVSVATWDTDNVTLD